MDTQSIDFRLSKAWNLASKDKSARPEHMWELCRLMSEFNIVVGNKQDISALDIGPFHIATTFDQLAALNLFIDSLLPTLISQFLSDQSLSQSLSGPLLFILKVVCTTLNSSFIIQEPLEWGVLIYIKNLNSISEHPTSNDIVKHFASIGYKQSNIKTALGNLERYKPLLGKAQSPLIIKNKEKFTSTV